MTEPAVSVVVPLYNKYLSVSRTVQSVLAQTIKDFELIIINDGSTDGSECSIKEINDNRLRMISQPNQGDGEARNSGIRAARANMIAFLDADDEWMPNFLSTVLALRARFPLAGAFTTSYIACQANQVSRYNYVGMDKSINGVIIPNYFRSSTLGASIVCSSNVMIPREVFDRVGFFSSGKASGIDQDMWIRIALQYPVAWSPIEAAVYHLSAENRRAGRYAQQDMPYAEYLELAIKSSRYSEPMKYWMAEYMRRHRLILASIDIQHKAFSYARALVYKTRRTKLFRARWLKVAMEAYCPNVLGRWAGRVFWAIAYRIGAKY
jgi:glycosyltransferase involved in cell wall biosynthesis